MSKASDNWTITRAENATYTYDWIVRNFHLLTIYREHWTDTEFYLNEQLWQLRFSRCPPDGPDDDEQEDVLCVVGSRPKRPEQQKVIGSKPILAEICSFSILNNENEKYLVRYEKIDNDEEEFALELAGVATFKELEKFENRLLVDDVLKIRFEVSCVFDVGSASSSKSQIVKVQPNSDNSDQKFRNMMELLFDEMSFSDVEFVIANSASGKRIAAHKNILAARVPFFAAMFKSDMKESVSNVVEVTDFTAEVFVEFLRFIYVGEVKKIDEHADALLIAADKYGLDDLRDHCVKYYSENLSVENAMAILDVADRFGIELLKQRATFFINANLAAVTKSIEFNEIASANGSAALLAKVLKSLS